MAEPPSDTYVFRHSLVHEAIADDLLPGERTRLHAAIAAVLERRPELAAARAESAAGELARHWQASHDLPRALPAAVAAERSLRASERAVALAPPDPPSPERAQALASLGQVLMLTGRLQESAPRCHEAIAMASEVGARATEGHARNTLGSVLGDLGDLDQAVGLLEEARRIAEEVESIDDLLRTYTNQWAALYAGGRLADALAIAQEGAERARMSGAYRSWGVPLTLTALAATYELGRWDESARLLSELSEVNLDGGGHEPQADLVRAMHDVATGRLQSAGRGLARARARGRRRLSEPQFSGPLFCALAELALWEGRVDDARAHALEARGHVAASDDVYTLAAVIEMLVRVEADRAERARALRRAVDEGALQEAHADIEALREQASTRIAGTSLLTLHLLQCRAEWSRAAGENDPAGWAAFSQAAELSGLRYRMAYGRWREAEALMAGGDRSAATRSLGQAQEVAAELGAGPLLAEVRALA